MDIVGLVPVGGQANRLQPIPGSKALLPVGYRNMPDGSVRPKPVSLYLLDKYKLAGASRTYFILRKGKWDIPEYYGCGSAVDINMHLAYLIIEIPYGTPYSLDQAYPFIKNDIVLLGFPDIMIGPDTLYKELLAEMDRSGADIVVGLYEVQSQQQARGTDMVDWDIDGKIRHIHIKPKSTTLRHAWVNAVWKPRFSEFMHEHLAEDFLLRQHDPQMKEIYVGRIVQAAVEAGLHVQAYLFPQHTFLDIGTPEGWAYAYKNYS